jgi:hypothetical protein
MERMTEKVRGSCGIAGETPEKLQRVPLRIDGPVQIRPDFFDLDGGLIYFPGVIPWYQMRATTLFQFRDVALDPTVDRGMINRQTTFQHDFLEISIAQCIPHIPPDTAE